MLFGGRKMKHKKQKKTKKAGRILLAVFAVLIGTLGVLLFTSERWMRKTWPNLSMEELVYQLKAPIAGTSHDLLMSYVCSSQARTQIPYLAVVHRLDQPVEGVLVFAKNKDAAGKLGRQVQDGTMKKEYLAVCEGKIEKQGVQKFEDFLVKDGRSNTSRVVQPGTAGAKKAVLEYEVIRTQENRTLVQIHLGTGRHHQIRVQFSHAGYPLAGDAKYGAKEKGSLALCAHHLELKHPRTGKQLSFTVKPEGEIFHSFV